MEESIFHTIIGGKRFLVIDLTKPISENVEVYPGDPKPKKRVFSNIHETGFEHYIQEIGDHNFIPHCDAPKHQISYLQDRGVEVFNNSKYWFNKACLIDLSNSLEAREIEGIKYLVKITKEHLLPFKEVINKKNAILIRSGYDEWIELNKKHFPGNIPHLTKEAAEFIASFDNLNVFGIDSITIDSPQSHLAHEILTSNKLVVESLVHLNKIPIKSRFDFTLQTKPLIIDKATGAPITAFAYIAIK